MFPISRDPPEGGTPSMIRCARSFGVFPISRDPPEGGTHKVVFNSRVPEGTVSNF